MGYECKVTGKSGLSADQVVFYVVGVGDRYSIELREKEEFSRTKSGSSSQRTCFILTEDQYKRLLSQSEQRIHGNFVLAGDMPAEMFRHLHFFDPFFKKAFENCHRLLEERDCATPEMVESLRRNADHAEILEGNIRGLIREGLANPKTLQLLVENAKNASVYLLVLDKGKPHSQALCESLLILTRVGGELANSANIWWLGNHAECTRLFNTRDKLELLFANRGIVEQYPGIFDKFYQLGLNRLEDIGKAFNDPGRVKEMYETLVEAGLDPQQYMPDLLDNFSNPLMLVRTLLKAALDQAVGKTGDDNKKIIVAFLNKKFESPDFDLTKEDLVILFKTTVRILSHDTNHFKARWMPGFFKADTKAFAAARPCLAAVGKLLGISDWEKVTTASEKNINGAYCTYSFFKSEIKKGDQLSDELPLVPAVAS
ncbi:hypothetical protein ACGP04_04325 [Piscirickettsia salmonis]|uniref:hypothetical protein n=1 Tax=Piscirickettsia salmonis TaxID=1238 RepID=UPI000F098F42|nr:hypothetical protein DA717_12785 [Piscirickettsiaceae bacterium NZ-RLO2]